MNCLMFAVNTKIAKDIWDVMHKKFILKDAGTHKCAIGNFRSFQIGCLGANLFMTKDRDVSSQIHDYHLLINDLAIEDIKLPKLLWLII